MKSIRASEPRRWQGGADRQALESRAAALAEAARPCPPLTPRALSRVRDQVLARRSGYRAAGPRWALVVVGLLILCATTVGGATIAWRRYVQPPRPTAIPGPPDPAAVLRPVVRPRPHVPLPLPSPNLDSEPPLSASPTAVATVRPKRAAEHTLSGRSHSPDPVQAPPAPSATAAPSSPTEAALLAEALVALRQGHDPRAALAALDRHARQFPKGVLEAEALRTRVEAVIQLGDMGEALTLLDRVPRADLLGAELLLTRAELRGEAGRFREALADFTELAGGAAGPLGAGGDERVLYGRAVCLGRLGEDARAREALLTYRERFPRGRFVSEVERLLAAPPRP